MRRFVAALAVWLLWTTAAPAADFEVGANAYDRGDYAAAYREFLPLAEQGDAFAQYNLGFMYAEGQGAPQSDAQAAEWTRKTAEQRDQEDIAIYSTLCTPAPGRTNKRGETTWAQESPSRRVTEPDARKRRAMAVRT